MLICGKIVQTALSYQFIAYIFSLQPNLISAASKVAVVNISCPYSGIHDDWPTI